MQTLLQRRTALEIGWLYSRSTALSHLGYCHRRSASSVISKTASDTNLLLHHSGGFLTPSPLSPLLPSPLITPPPPRPTPHPSTYTSPPPPPPHPSTSTSPLHLHLAPFIYTHHLHLPLSPPSTPPSSTSHHLHLHFHLITSIYTTSPQFIPHLLYLHLYHFYIYFQPLHLHHTISIYTSSPLFILHHFHLYLITSIYILPLPPHHLCLHLIPSIYTSPLSFMPSNHIAIPTILPTTTTSSFSLPSLPLPILIAGNQHRAFGWRGRNN